MYEILNKCRFLTYVSVLIKIHIITNTIRGQISGGGGGGGNWPPLLFTSIF